MPYGLTLTARMAPIANPLQQLRGIEAQRPRHGQLLITHSGHTSHQSTDLLQQLRSIEVQHPHARAVCQVLGVEGRA